MGTILVVDDDRLIRKIAGDILSKGCHKVLSAKYSVEGLDVLRSEEVEVVLLDVVMPGESGFDMIPKIKAINNDITVIIMTAYASVESAIEAIRKGADDFIPKPFHPEELLHSVKKALEKYGLVLENRSLVEKLEEYSKNLESMVEKRTKELEKANEELKSTQAQLLQTEKLSSLGQLAAGVAHEINNPIGFVNSNLRTMNEYVDGIRGILNVHEKIVKAIRAKDCSSLRERLKELDQTKKRENFEFMMTDIVKLVEESREGTYRVYKIVRDLRDFSRADDAERKFSDIHRAIDSTVNIVWNEIKYKAEVIKDYGDIPEVECLPTQLNQVFMNLIVNAAHAIEDKGKIMIKTYDSGDSVFVEINDTGSGIPPEIVNKIFDPFFTTKEPGKGTGLGLSIAYNIIKKHKGHINVESRVGVGTRFIIELPVEMGIAEEGGFVDDAISEQTA